MSIEESELARSSCSDESDDLLRGDKRYPFYTVLFFVCLVMLLLMPEQVEVMSDEGWYLQPALGPLIGLVTMLLFSFVQICGALLRLVRISPSVWLEYIYEVVSESRVAIITSILFYVFLQSIDKIGFFLSTFLLITTLIFLTRLLNRFWLLMAFMATVLIMLIFRVAIGLWMDDVWLYELLPNAVADFCNMYL
ncbi:hypothetical protein KQ940_18095 [Marinobacterium sp. D7]|uniref:hypothetical protein n=1 Tax=Marinobacterium ramblicola TaxID=2849041 RepID=UPI001C2D1AB5|nr:hypothetical protein [Marinobacterium ramblicola]MBV1789970.1 hypothetical protein [Marinobacterium ramblicola]